MTGMVRLTDTSSIRTMSCLAEEVLMLVGTVTRGGADALHVGIQMDGCGQLIPDIGEKAVDHENQVMSPCALALGESFLASV